MNAGTPQRVRVTGLIAAGVGVLAMVSALGFAFASAHLTQRSRTGAPGGELPFLTAHYLPTALIQGTLGALFVIAGVALSGGREWGRRVLVGLVYLLIPCSLSFMFAGSRGEMLDAGMIAVTAPCLGLIYLAIRWLKSPAMRGAPYAAVSVLPSPMAKLDITMAKERPARRAIWLGDTLLIASGVCFVGFIGLLGSVFVSPHCVPVILRDHWYLVVGLGFLLAGILWLWMMVHAVTLLHRTPERRAVAWLLALLFLGAPAGWVYYATEFRSRRAPT